MPRLGVGLGLGLRQAVSGGGGFDPDAAAFFARVTAAGGTLTATEQTATNSLVVQMKADGIWTSMKAIYPMVGASAAACAQNLVSASFTGVFSSGWTFASTGVTGNGTSAFMNTNCAPNNMGQNSLSGFIYNRTDNTQITLNGCTNFEINDFDPGRSLFGAVNNLELSIGVQTTTAGFWGVSRVSSSGWSAYKSGANFYTAVQGSTTPSANSVFISSRNTGTPTTFGNKEVAFFSIGDGLTDPQASNFYTAVQTFNQTLNRQVGAQIVSDADAQAYVDRVYTAGGTLTNTEANAVNQLTIDMKAANVWTAMKAVYPMVGSSAAACAQNLKSSSFTGTFTSGWTFASTGVTPNGTSAYMSTNLNPSTSLTNNNLHFSYYSRTNVNETRQDFNASNANPATNEIFLTMFANTLFFTANTFSPNTVSIAVANTLGFVIGNTTANNVRNIWKGGTKLATDTSTNTAALPNITTLLSARANPIQEFSTKQQAFASIGDGLTDQNATDFYTAVQTFQTTLSRQVI